MNRPTAAVGSVLFFAVAPGVVAGLVPWWLTPVAGPRGAGSLGTGARRAG